MTNKLVIHRAFLDIKIDRSQIASLELLDKEKVAGSIRTFGVSGLFGYYGKFANTNIGSMTWYATRRNKKKQDDFSKDNRQQENRFDTWRSRKICHKLLSIKYVSHQQKAIGELNGFVSTLKF